MRNLKMCIHFRGEMFLKPMILILILYTNPFNLSSRMQIGSGTKVPLLGLFLVVFSAVNRCSKYSSVVNVVWISASDAYSLREASIKLKLIFLKDRF
jgi:hypothetical protein